MSKLRWLHQWIGLLLSIVVLAVSVSGGVLLFADDIHRASYPVIDSTPASSITRYAEVLEKVEASKPSLIKFPQPEMNTFRLWFEDESEAFVDANTGETIAHWQWYESVPSILFALHSNLFAGETGELINGVFAIGALFLIGSGILLWWNRRQHFRLSFILPGRFNLKNILRNHAAIGLTGSIPATFFVLTGVIMVFYSTVAFAITSLLDESAPGRPDAVVIPQQSPVRSWDEILEKVDMTFPDGQLVYYYPPRSDNATMIFRKRLPGEWHPNGRSYIVINPYSGEVIQTINALKEQLGVRIMNSIYPLHAAKIGGSSYTIIALMASIILTLLACTGLISYTLVMRRKYILKPGS